MFDELDKYTHKDHFFYDVSKNLKHVCNAPSDKGGVYIVFALKHGGIEPVYIGCSGRQNADGSIFVRKAGLGGLKDRLVNGKQFGLPRRTSWKVIMAAEKIEALDIYWYATHDETYVDCPRKIEKIILQRFYEIYGRLPKWNNEL